MERLADFLAYLKGYPHQITLHAPNLHKRTLLHPETNVPESLLERLRRLGLAEQRGERGLWWVAREGAIPVVLDAIAETRPGRPPGQKVTLTEEQTAAFLANLPPNAAPTLAMRTALRAATGWSEETIARVELIGLRVPQKDTRS